MDSNSKSMFDPKGKEWLFCENEIPLNGALK